MKAFGYKKRLPISNTESRMDSEVPTPEDSLRDTFWVPPATDDGPAVLKVVIPFTDPVIVGRFVYHCHSVNHEDRG
jgi:FtsP/CotA-like multicopper oxidase with cupredoxin domain